MKGNVEQDFLSSHESSFDDEFCKMEMEQEDDGGSDRLQIDTVRFFSIFYYKKNQPESSLSNELYEEEIRAEFQSDFDDEGPGRATSARF